MRSRPFPLPQIPSFFSPGFLNQLRERGMWEMEELRGDERPIPFFNSSETGEKGSSKGPSSSDPVKKIL